MTGGDILQIAYYKQMIQSKTKGDFYVVRLCIVDSSGKVLSYSNPVFWITKEQFDALSLPIM